MSKNLLNCAPSELLNCTLSSFWGFEVYCWKDPLERDLLSLDSITGRALQVFMSVEGLGVFSLGGPSCKLYEVELTLDRPTENLSGSIIKCVSLSEVASYRNPTHFEGAGLIGGSIGGSDDDDWELNFRWLR